MEDKPAVPTLEAFRQMREKLRNDSLDTMPSRVTSIELMKRCEGCKHYRSWRDMLAGCVKDQPLGHGKCAEWEEGT